MSTFGEDFGTKEVILKRSQFKKKSSYFSTAIFRQEFLGLQTQYIALESKIKDLAIQHSRVSGATHALSDLSSRLNDLVDQLIGSYNISEQELEVNKCFGQEWCFSSNETIENII